jgi:N-acyl-D-aspartate/D-glutamate deacylase
MTNDDEEQIGRMLNDDALLLGLSDAGAHTSQLCDADFATYLLQHWVRERGALPLEKAVWRLTGQPAELLGFAGRGRLAPGAVADVVAFDAKTVGTRPLERVRDFPAGADRLVARSTGIEHVFVAGRPIRRGGADVAGARPGAIVRPTRS